jgi:uncharacterized membrane protein YgcG
MTIMRQLIKQDQAVLLATLLTIVLCISVYSQDAQRNRSRENRLNGGEENGPNGAYSFESFDIVHNNNIFDPNRRPNRPSRERELPPAPPPPQNEHIELLGVMITEEKAVAFFECSNAAFSGPCEQGEEVAGFFLMEVYPGGVMLKQENLQTVLPVGSRLNKQGDQEWRIAEAPYRPITRQALTPMASSRNNPRGGRGNNQNQQAMDQVRQAMQRMGGMGGGRGGQRGGGGGRGGGRGGGGRGGNTQVRSFTFDASGGQAVYAIRGGDVAIDLMRTQR